MNSLLVDTTVFIAHLRQRKEASEFLIKQSSIIHLSYISWGELLQGVKSKKHYNEVDEIVSVYKVLWGTRKTEQLAIELLQNYTNSGIDLYDALIAATTMENNMTLVTYNLKHFKKVKGLKVRSPA